MTIYKDPQGDVMRLLVINQAGHLRCLYAPFRVVCIKPVNDIKLDTQVLVEAVVGTVQGDILYIIFQQPVPHSFFQIVIKF